MNFTNRIIIALLVILLCAPLGLGQDTCPVDKQVVELKDQDQGVHLVVENCENVGTFSIGGLYEGSFEKLTYAYPNPWRGTFLTINSKGEYYANSDTPELISNGTNSSSKRHLDQYLIKRPYKQEDSILTEWLLPGNVSIKQTLNLTDNGVILSITAENKGDKASSFGTRIHLDTMLGGNDGAPIYIPGDGLKSKERVYAGDEMNFRYWKAYNQPENPSVIATGVLSQSDRELSHPNKLVVADWKKSMRSIWDYNTSDTTILGDSAVLLYFTPTLIEPEKEIEFKTKYVNGEPILPEARGDFGVTEIITDKIEAEYCPGKEIEVKVDVLSRNTSNEGVLDFKAIDEEGNVVYREKKSTGEVQPDTVKSMRYAFNGPSNITSGLLKLEAKLIKEGKEIDNRSTNVLLDESLCPETKKKKEEKGLIDRVLSPSFIFVLLLLILLVSAYFIYHPERGKVTLKKQFNEEKDIITVRAENNTNEDIQQCVIEDYIPEGVEINVFTGGVLRKKDRLVWELGTLKAEDSASLEYEMKEETVLKPATLKWENGEIRSDE